MEYRTAEIRLPFGVGVVTGRLEAVNIVGRAVSSNRGMIWAWLVSS